jgi:hypothetical protein
LVEETWVPGKNPPACRKSLTNIIYFCVIQLITCTKLLHVHLYVNLCKTAKYTRYIHLWKTWPNVHFFYLLRQYVIDLSISHVYSASVSYVIMGISLLHNLNSIILFVIKHYNATFM